MSVLSASSITANIAKILIIIGMIFVIWKIINKNVTNNRYEQIETKKKLIWYNIHKAAFIIATILGFVHGIMVNSSPEFILSGWILGISMLIMSAQGIYLGFQSNWQPFTSEQDRKYKGMRITKWILTLIMFLSIAWHYFPMM